MTTVIVPIWKSHPAESSRATASTSQNSASMIDPTVNSLAFDSSLHCHNVLGA